MTTTIDTRKGGNTRKQRKGAERTDRTEKRREMFFLREKQTLREKEREREKVDREEILTKKQRTFIQRRRIFKFCISALLERFTTYRCS